jgi:crotonobetainyl-CoA:carnitine CoA-transferase CaiB-like acyl-CoA transferase
VSRRCLLPRITAHRSMIVEETDYKALGNPIKLSRTLGAVRTTPQPFGAETRAICRMAGLEDTEINTLVEKRVAFQAA